MLIVKPRDKAEGKRPKSLWYFEIYLFQSGEERYKCKSLEFYWEEEEATSDVDCILLQTGRESPLGREWTAEWKFLQHQQDYTTTLYYSDCPLSNQKYNLFPIFKLFPFSFFFYFGWNIFVIWKYCLKTLLGNPGLYWDSGVAPLS